MRSNAVERVLAILVLSALLTPAAAAQEVAPQPATSPASQPLFEPWSREADATQPRPPVTNAEVRLPLFTDDPLTTGTPVKALHFKELQAAVNALRAARGMWSFNFGLPVPAVGSPVRASDLAALRSAIKSTRYSMGLGAVPFTDGTLTARATTVKRAHIDELRNALVTSWCSLCDDANACTADNCGAPIGCTHSDSRTAFTAPAGLRYRWRTPDTHVSLYAGPACSPWCGEYPNQSVPEPAINHCGPSAGMNILFWYNGRASDPASLYRQLGSEMRTNEWDTAFGKAQTCACVCSALFGSWCPVCLCPTPDCLTACYLLADELIKIGTLPEDMWATLVKHTPRGYRPHASRGNPGVAAMERYLAKGDPLVVLINNLPYNLHWTLVTGTYDEYGTLMVRFANQAPLSWDKFVALWGFEGMDQILKRLCEERGVRPYIWMRYEKTTILEGGQGVLAGQENAIYSTDGRFMFFLDSVGHLVLYPTPIVLGTSYWHSNNAVISNPRAAVMQTDGNLVIFDTNGRAVWSSGTYGHAGAYLAVQDDGNIVIYTKDHKSVLWSTNTCCH